MAKLLYRLLGGCSSIFYSSTPYRSDEVKDSTSKPKLKKFNLKPPVIEPAPLPKNIKPLTPKPLVDELFLSAYIELERFVADKFDMLRADLASGAILETYSIRNNSLQYEEGWRTGFGRCLAEMKRLLQQSEHSIREDKS